MSDDIKPRIIGMTPFTDTIAEYECWEKFFIQKTRHAEILLWIEQNAYTGSWVALDDSWREFPDPCQQLIRCETELGLTTEVERILVDVFTRQMRDGKLVA